MPEEVKPPLEDGYRPEGSGQEESRFDTVHPSGAPTIVGKVCGQGGPKTAGSAFTDRRASTPFPASYGPSGTTRWRGLTRSQTAPGRVPKATGSGSPDPTSGRVNEETIESRAEVGPEVRVSRSLGRPEGARRPHQARYTDIVAITSANPTAKGLKRIVGPGPEGPSGHPRVGSREEYGGYLTEHDHEGTRRPHRNPKAGPIGYPQGGSP